MTVVTITAWYQDGHLESVHVNMLNSCEFLEDIAYRYRLFQDRPQTEKDLQVPWTLLLFEGSEADSFQWSHSLSTADSILGAA